MRIIDPKLPLFIEFVRDNSAVIIDELRMNLFGDHRIKKEFIKFLEDTITGPGGLPKLLERYEWRPDNCPYDHSGDVYETGVINIDESVADFIEEYDGGWKPTFESGRGKEFTRLEEGISEYLMMEPYNVSRRIIHNMLDDKFPGEINDDNFQDILDELDWEISDMIDDAGGLNVLYYDGLIDYYGLSDQSVRNVIDKDLADGYSALFDFSNSGDEKDYVRFSESAIRILKAADSTTLNNEKKQICDRVFDAILSVGGRISVTTTLYNDVQLILHMESDKSESYDDLKSLIEYLLMHDGSMIIRSYRSKIDEFDIFFMYGLLFYNHDCLSISPEQLRECMNTGIDENEAIKSSKEFYKCLLF